MLKRNWLAASVLSMLSCVCAAAETPLLKFDFGSESSPLQEGYTRVTPKSAYDDAAGFGWRTNLRVVPSVQKWWAPEEKGGIIAAFDTQKGSPLATDYVFGFHFFGWPHAPEDKDGVNRLNIKMDDDLKTDFIVKLQPGKYALVIGMGDLATSHRVRPFNVAVNGQALAANLSCQSVTLKRAVNVDCPDGKLVVTFSGCPDYKHPYPWNQCTWWMVNFLLVAPQPEEKLLDQELATLQSAQFEILKKQYIPAGVPSKFAVRDGYLVKDDKPFLRLLWHGWGWEDTLKYYRLYAWTNTLNLGPGNRTLFYYDDWLRDGWRERAAVDGFPSDWFTQASQAYPFGYLVNYYLGRDYMQYLPASYRQAHPEEVAVNAKGESQGSVRYAGAPGGDLFTARVATVVADLAKLHPASATIELFEEYWIPDWGFNPEAVQGYRQWLQKRFGTIEKLNTEWATTFKDFAEISPPKTSSEQSGNGINHLIWRGEMCANGAKVAYDAIKAADPSRPVAGAKGTFPISSWYYAPATDIFGWYGHANMAIARAAADFFGKITEPVHVNICQHQTMRGDVPVDPWPFMNYRTSAYSLMLTRVIDGAKSIFNEDYVLGHDFHYFHRTKFLRGQKLEGTLGGKVLLDRDDYPDVYMESKSLQLARVNQLLLRLAPVLLPARIPRAKIALLATTESDAHGGVSPYYGNTVMQPVYLLKMLQLPFDVLREPQFERFKDYEVLILTSLASALKPQAVEQIKSFVANGGKVLFLPPTANTDARMLKPSDFGWETIAGCKVGAGIDSGGDLKIQVSQNEWITSLKAGDALPGFEKLQSGRLPALTLTDATALAEVGGKPVAALAKNGRVATVCLPQSIAAWAPLGARHFDQNTVRFFSDLFEQWKVERPVTLKGAGETCMVDAGVLQGPDYWLVLLASYSTQAQQVAARLGFLPAEGAFDVVDVTGERPLVAKDVAGQNHFAPDPQFRRSFFAAKNAAGAALRNDGLELELGALGGRVLLIRPAAEKVWVNCPAFELQALARKPCVIIAGAGCEKAAATIQQALAAIGNQAAIQLPETIKTRQVSNKVVIDGFTVETFENTPLDVNTHLVLVGNEANNAVIQRLGAEGTFCFDKVLQKVDEKFPGPGRGLLEVVESVSNEAYDATTNSRDALLVGGSDAAGVENAAQRLAEILKP